MTSNAQPNNAPIIIGNPIFASLLGTLGNLGLTKTQINAFITGVPITRAIALEYHPVICTAV